MRIFLGSVAALALAGCSTLGAPSHSEVRLGQDSVVRVGNADAEAHKKKGELLSLESEPVLVESPGKVSVMILPENGAGEVTLNLRSLNRWSGEAFEKRVDSTVEEVLAGVGRVYALMSAQKPREALARIEELESRYPKIAYLGFLKASCLLVLGDRGKAKIVLEEALTQAPDNPEGKELYRALTHGNRVPSSSGENDR